MPYTRRALVASLITGSAIGIAGCSLQSPHSDQIRLTNERASHVTLDVSGTPVPEEEPTFERQVRIQAGAVEHVADPTRSGQTTVPYVIRIATTDGLSARREWEPANVATQLQASILGDAIQWDVGAPE
jgi:hypothetical protein